jgi:Ca-activated chloride channel homolog
MRFAQRMWPTVPYSLLFLGAIALASATTISGGPSRTSRFSPSEQGTISVETQLVVLPVRVTDANGDFVSRLTQEQFRVFEDGRQPPITLFRQEDTPVTVGLMVDHSRSMGPKLSEVSEAVAAFAHSSNPDDEMFVVDFSDNVSLEMPGGKPFTSNPMELA